MQVSLCARTQLARWRMQTNVVIVELAAFDELETVAGVKTIRGTLFQRADFNR